jgi:outer membrane lipoprotein-sorting protein
MVEDVFTNVQVLKGIPVDDFMGTMGIMSAALGFCCSECHTGAGTDLVNWEADTPRKRTARRMVLMVQAINKNNFAGRQVVTCWTCHRGRDVPVVTPALDTVYGEARVEPDDLIANIPDGPSAESILDRYIQAAGGAERLAKMTSFIAKGTSVGYGGSGEGSQVEIMAQAPDQRATRIRFTDPDLRDAVRSFNGKEGWIATPLTVVAEYQVVGGELDGARLDAQLSFPAQIKQLLTNWRVGLPTSINDREMQVVQGSGPRGLIATFYFDKETGLLQRVIRYADSPIGRVPTQTDFTDYRDVNGIKMPFRWTFSWLDGQDNFEMSDFQLNAKIDPARFGRPPAR